VSDEMTPAEALSERVAALTAEVQRLRGVVGELRALVYFASQHVDQRETMHAIRDRLAALTPPAADTEGK